MPLAASKKPLIKGNVASDADCPESGMVGLALMCLKIADDTQNFKPKLYLFISVLALPAVRGCSVIR
jgi:hypothetical protein